MPNRLRITTRLFTLVLALLPALEAQQTAEITVPRIIRVSSSLAAGGSTTGKTGVLFSIYRDQYEGAPLWSEAQNIQTDKNGAYSALLGSTRNEGLPVDLFNTTEQRWLEVEVNGVKEPRVLIGSIPYAMVAADSQMLGGLPASAYLRASAPATSATVVSESIGLAPAVSQRRWASSRLRHHHWLL